MCTPCGHLECILYTKMLLAVDEEAFDVGADVVPIQMLPVTKRNSSFSGNDQW